MVVQPRLRAVRGPLLLASLLITATSTLAAETYGIIGGGITVGESAYAVDGSQAEFTPNVFYNSPRAYLDGAFGGLRLHPWLALNAQWRFAEVSDDLDTRAPGIRERDGNAELGVSIGTVGARLTYLADVGDVHRGTELQLHLGRTLPLPGFTLTPYLEIDYQSDALARHLYSVSATESAASGLRPFAADSGFVYQAGLIGLTPLRDRWILLTRLDLIRPDFDSPLLTNTLGSFFELGLVYRFSGEG